MYVIQKKTCPKEHKHLKTYKNKTEMQYQNIFVEDQSLHYSRLCKNHILIMCISTSPE